MVPGFLSLRCLTTVLRWRFRGSAILALAAATTLQAVVQRRGRQRHLRSGELS